MLTHSHADAVLGLDDLRNFTFHSKRGQGLVKVYLNRDTMDYVTRAFPYLVDSRMATGGGDVSSAKYIILDAKGEDCLESFHLESSEDGEYYSSLSVTPLLGKPETVFERSSMTFG